MSENRTACLCVIDDGSKPLDSYLSWHTTFLRETNVQKSFDVYVASVDEKKFFASELFKLLEQMQAVGLVGRIFTIQFYVYDLKSADEKVLKLSTLCENFREVNQFLNNLSYVFYYQCQIDFNPSIKKTESFKRVFDQNLDTDVAYLAKGFKHSHGFFATANRQNFSNLQNFYSYFNAEPCNWYEFVFEKYLVNTNLDVILLLEEEKK